MTTPPFSGHHCSFVVACNEKGGELLAVELPGRESRRAEQRFLTLRDAAAALFPILAPTLNQPGVPYVMIGHSMGTWMLFETLKLLMSKGVALPAQVCCRPAFVRPSRHTTLRTACTRARSFIQHELLQAAMSAPRRVAICSPCAFWHWST